jgi:hypothetical protein
MKTKYQVGDTVWLVYAKSVATKACPHCDNLSWINDYYAVEAVVDRINLTYSKAGIHNEGYITHPVDPVLPRGEYARDVSGVYATREEAEEVCKRKKEA